MIEKMKEILEEILENKVEISQDTNVIDDLGMDSLQIIKFMLRVEEEFDLEVDYETFDFDILKSIGQFCEYVKNS